MRRLIYPMLLLVLVHCNVDYRTDQERAFGVVLDQETIENRKYANRELNTLQQRDEDEKHWREAYRYCATRQLHTLECF